MEVRYETTSTAASNSLAVTEHRRIACLCCAWLDKSSSQCPIRPARLYMVSAPYHSLYWHDLRSCTATIEVKQDRSASHLWQTPLAKASCEKPAAARSRTHHDHQTDAGVTLPSEAQAQMSPSFQSVTCDGCGCVREDGVTAGWRVELAAAAAEAIRVIFTSGLLCRFLQEPLTSRTWHLHVVVGREVSECGWRLRLHAHRRRSGGRLQQDKQCSECSERCLALRHPTNDIGFQLTYTGRAAGRACCAAPEWQVRWELLGW
jgi:hypothetical protein